MSRARGITIVVALVLAAAVAVVAVAYPSVAATTCPGCYGLTELSDGVYVERGLSDAQRRQVGRTVTDAGERVRRFYGGRVSAPRLIVCLTEECYRGIGGGKEKGVAVLNRAVMLSPRGLDPVIAAHELSHVELHARLDGEVPQWFDEGLAVVVSGDPRYLAPAGPGDRCLVVPTGPLPGSLDGWLRAASADPDTYAKAACRVSRWLAANDGGAGFHRLIARLNAGTSFTTAVPIP